MVDLTGQYQPIKDEIDSAIQDVINSAAFINGPVVREFSSNLQNYLGVKHVVPCANGTDALQVVLMSAGLKPGDEVISPAFTFIATIEVISLLGLKPVIVDVDPGTFNLSPEAIEKAITPKTKAIIPVHLFGQCADMDGIMEIAEKYNLFVLEDACQAIGAKYNSADIINKSAGTIGNAGCTSFFPSKNLGAYGDGGAIFTNDTKLADMFSSVVNHGMKIRYYHDIIGVNSRLDSIQAAILNVKLKYLDHYILARQKVAAFYDKSFSGNPFLSIPEHFSKSTHVFHQYTLKTNPEKRDSLIKHLAAKQIPAMIYYPVPLHLQKAFGYLGYQKGDFPVSENLSGSVFSLPMHTELEDEQLNFIVSAVNEFFD